MDGNLMYRFPKKLGLLKPKLKALDHLHTSHISSCVIDAKTKCVRWIEVYMFIVIFSIAINRESYGFFPSFRGLR